MLDITAIPGTLERMRRGFEWRKRQMEAARAASTNDDSPAPSEDSTPPLIEKSFSIPEEDIRTWPSLHPAASSAGEYKLLRLWYLMRWADTQGGGRLSIADIAAALDGVLAYETIRQTLNDGDGEWWDIYTDKQGRRCVRLYGVARIAERFELDRFNMRWVEVPVSAFTDGFQKFAGYMLAAWLTARRYPEHPITKATLSALFGSCEKTIFNWLRSAGADVQAQYAELAIDDIMRGMGGEYVADVGERDIESRMAGVSSDVRIVQRDGVDCLRWQIGNTYNVDDVTVGRRGVGRKVHKLQRARLFDEGMRDGSTPRLYFDGDAKALRRDSYRNGFIFREDDVNGGVWDYWAGVAA